MRFIDLFAGVGGTRLGMERAGHECVWSCEIDKWCQAVYRHHWGQVEAGDARRVDPATIPDFDVLCAGFPCQSFSLAGKRGGFEDARGTLFYEICRIARAKRPQMLLLENVKGLLSADDRLAFKVVLESLGELGYDVEWQVLNSKNHGVPQNRERVFIVGHLGGLSGREVFPVLKGGGEHDEMAGEAEAGGQGVGGQVASALRGGDKWEPVVTDLGTNYHKGWGGGRTLVAEEKPMIVDTKKVGEPRFYDIAPTLQSNDYKEPLKVVEGKPFMIHNVYGGFGEKEPRVFKEHSPTIRTPKGGGHLPYIVEPTILKKHRKDEIRNHGSVCPTLTESHEHHGGANPPLIVKPCLTPDRARRRQQGRRFKENGESMFTLTGQDIHGVAILNATNPHSKDERREYHYGNEARALKGPSGNQESLILNDTERPPKASDFMDIQEIINWRIRRLTPRECERLQGFPDDWTRWGLDESGKKIEISDTQRYKMMGNAVTVNVVEFLARRLPT